MKLGKNFFRGRSQLSQDPDYQDPDYQDPRYHNQQYVASEAGAVLTRQFGSLRSTGNGCQVDLAPNPVQRGVVARPQFGSSNKAPRRTIRTAAVGLMLKGVERCGHGADLLLANFPAGILSWIFAQFFAGCAAYAEAMYPSIAFQGHEDGDRLERPHDGPSERADSGRSPSLSPNLAPNLAPAVAASRSPSPAVSLAPGLRGASQSKVDGDKQRSSLAGRNRAAAGSFATEKVVRLDLVRRSPGERASSIHSLVAAWLARRRRSAGEVQTIVELRNHNRRVLKGTRLSRYSTE